MLIYEQGSYCSLMNNRYRRRQLCHKKLLGHRSFVSRCKLICAQVLSQDGKGAPEMVHEPKPNLVEEREQCNEPSNQPANNIHYIVAAMLRIGVWL